MIRAFYIFDRKDFHKKSYIYTEVEGWRMEKKRIVVKIGSSSLTNSKGEIDQEKFIDHVEAVSALREQGHEVLLVSSGAVAAGFSRLGYPTRPVTLKGRQAAAAVGQSLLIQSYIESLVSSNHACANFINKK